MPHFTQTNLQIQAIPNQSPKGLWKTGQLILKSTSKSNSIAKDIPEE